MAVTQDIAQLRAVMRFYAGYRLVLAAALCLLFFFGPDKSILGSTNHALFALASPIYLALAFVAVLRHSFRVNHYSHTELFFEFFVDIAAITLLSFSSGSADSGLQLLLFVTISASSITLPGRLSLSIASLASIAGLAEVAAHTLKANVPTQQFIVAGMLGTAYFSTAIAIRYLSLRIVSTQGLAERRRSDIVRLSRINQMIVQRMQTGIMVISAEGQIKLINAAALELLDSACGGEGEMAPAVLVELVQSGRHCSKILPLGESKTEVHVNMTTLDSNQDSDRLLYLENLSKLSQRAQNLKLASLGRFTASIAHEIRNPLSAISHAAQLLGENPSLAEEDRRFVTMINTNTTRMNNVVKNILEMSRGRPPQPERFDLGQWLQNFIDEWRPTEGVAYSLQLESQSLYNDITVDPGQLRQILSNIAENGIRHGAAHAEKAFVRFRISKSGVSQAVILDIIDNGPGIAAEEEDKIFEPFYTTETQGNGLGLYLSRELCLANQISIHYRRDFGKDSCFRLLFSHPDRGALPE